jgi:Rrf2 family protein
MVLSKTTSYSLRILIRLASLEGEEITAGRLQQELAIPNRYLRRLLTELTKHGLIRSIQGRYGGYLLARRSDTIRISEVIEAIEDFESLNQCILGVPDCALKEKCAMHDIWEEIKNKMVSTFSGTSLHDLKNRSMAG